MVYVTAISPGGSSRASRDAIWWAPVAAPCRHGTVGGYGQRAVAGASACWRGDVLSHRDRRAPRSEVAGVVQGNRRDAGQAGRPVAATSSGGSPSRGLLPIACRAGRHALFRRPPTGGPKAERLGVE